MEPTAPVSPGWYPHPNRPGIHWWDGRQWADAPDGAAPTTAPYSAAPPPVSPYAAPPYPPASQYPTSQYQTSQYPTSQYPTSQYPTSQDAPQYPAPQHPGSPYPGSPYPGSPYPASPYPGSPYPASQYPSPPPYAPHAGRSRSTHTGNSYAITTMIVSAVYVVLALTVGIVLLGIFPALMTVRSFQARERLAPAALVAAVVAVGIAIALYRR